MTRHPLSALLQQTTRAIVASYEASRDPAQHLDPDRRRPSRTAVVRILERLFAVLYPGFYGIQHLTRDNVEFHVGALLDDVVADLYDQVLLAFQLDETPAQLGDGTGAPERAEGAVEWFLARLPELRRLLVLDLTAAMGGDPAARSYAEIVLAYPGFEAITVQRIAHELWDLGVPLVPRIMTEIAHSKTGIDIHPGATIGDSFFIDHGTGVVIGETTIIGKNVKIYQGVTLGALSFPRDPSGRLLRGVKRHPTLEDDVVVYSGATILGGDTVIGKGAVIGGNTWVIESVAPGDKVLFTRTSTARQRRILERAYGFGEGI
jgi:serine O-acetyltransferase